MVHMYANNELVDMLLMYGECHQVAAEAARRYAERFPNRHKVRATSVTKKEMYLLYVKPIMFRVYVSAITYTDQNQREMFVIVVTAMLQIVEDTYQLIYAYNNGKREKSEYEKTLKSICDVMNDELPSEILVYLLTLVDMPHEDGNQLPIMEKIQKTYSCLAERQNVL
ncbi:hypothetical protein NQ317_015959 [Molorchus minor]|uniref:DUF4817 domain-containing protein n=1 Tax=Molorchus minor TaxID=1323400 RepID=A0ABQ9JKJ1_9CUCU|nr:hypothetical protein NQ317_015959 [Molorchus minor]